MYESASMYPPRLPISDWRFFFAYGLFFLLTLCTVSTLITFDYWAHPPLALVVPATTDRNGHAHHFLRQQGMKICKGDHEKYSIKICTDSRL